LSKLERDKGYKSDRLDRLDNKTGCHKDGYNNIRQDNGSGKTTRKAARDDSGLNA
jgi:hypothetical protein